MQKYDPTRPLIFIHVPKTAGRSVKTVFRQWFGKGMHEHYFNEELGQMPPRRDSSKLAGQVIFGHFNRLRGFGIEHYYPAVTQFVTILRDPFEMAVSTYFYLRKVAAGWKDPGRRPTATLESFVMSTPPNMLNHFPRPVTHENYRDQIDRWFIEVGITEWLPESLQRISEKLGVPPAGTIPRENVSLRDAECPSGLRAQYEARHPLEFEVYEYAKRRFRENRPSVAQPPATLT